MTDLCYELLRPCACAFVACLGFSILFNIHGAGILICAFGGTLGWLCYLLSAPLGSDIVQSFLAAVVISLYSEIMARPPLSSHRLSFGRALSPGARRRYLLLHGARHERRY